jgi:photosystem II stability/assembly factor-like uncharacterized protein
VTAFAFDPVNPDIVYVGTVPGSNKGRVYKSGDSGEHLRLISGRGWTWLGALASDPERPGTLYAGTGNAVYKTTDGGQTWRAFNQGLLPPPGINRGEGWVDWLAVDPTNSNVLYEHDYANTIRKSVDGGKTWKTVLSLWRQGSISALLLTPGQPPILYGAFSYWGPGGPVTTITASTGPWKNTPLSVSDTWNHPPVVAFAADASQATIYVAIRGRVYSSTNAGRSWQSIAQGLPQGAVVTGLAAGAGTVCAAFGTNGIYVTADQGRTWTQSWPDSGSARGLGAGVLAVDPARPTTIYAGVDQRKYRIIKSTDSGRTWAIVG